MILKEHNLLLDYYMPYHKERICLVRKKLIAVGHLFGVANRKIITVRRNFGVADRNFIAVDRKIITVRRNFGVADRKSGAGRNKNITCHRTSEPRVQSCASDRERIYETQRNKKDKMRREKGKRQNFTQIVRLSLFYIANC